MSETTWRHHFGKSLTARPWSIPWAWAAPVKIFATAPPGQLCKSASRFLPGAHIVNWSLHAASKSAFQIKKQKITLQIIQKEDAGVQVPCLVLANVCNMLTMPVVATKCLVYLLNTVGKCRACRWMGWDCALKGAPTAAFWQSCLSLPVQISSLFSYSIYIYRY